MKKINLLIITLISIILFISCNPEKYHYNYLIEVKYSNDSQDTISYEITSNDAFLDLDVTDNGGLFRSANNMVCLTVWFSSDGFFHSKNIACDVKYYKIIKCEKIKIDSK